MAIFSFLLIFSTLFLICTGLTATDGGVTESSTAVTSGRNTPTIPPTAELCRNAAVDAATTFNSTTYFFKGLFRNSS